MCAYHADIQASETCARCGSFVCPRCVVRARSATWCVRCGAPAGPIRTRRALRAVQIGVSFPIVFLLIYRLGGWPQAIAILTLPIACTTPVVLAGLEWWGRARGRATRENTGLLWIATVLGALELFSGIWFIAEFVTGFLGLAATNS